MGEYTTTQEKCSLGQSFKPEPEPPSDFGMSVPVSSALPAFPRACRWLNIKAAFASWHCAAMQWHEHSI